MDEIRQLESSPRVVVRRQGVPDPDGGCIVYWMRRSLRALENPSLDVAIDLGNALAKPTVVFFALVPSSTANLRHYTFLAEGLAETQEELQEKGVGFVLRRYPDHSVAKFCNEVRASILVTDENPLRGPERRLQKVTRQLQIPVWSVD